MLYCLSKTAHLSFQIQKTTIHNNLTMIDGLLSKAPLFSRQSPGLSLHLTPIPMPPPPNRGSGGGGFWIGGSNAKEVGDGFTDDDCFIVFIFVGNGIFGIGDFFSPILQSGVFTYLSTIIDFRIRLARMPDCKKSDFHRHLGLGGCSTHPEKLMLAV